MKAYISAMLILYFVSCGNSDLKNKSTAGSNRTNADSCDNPDAPISCNFVNEPKDPGSIIKIAGSSEPGMKIIIRGQILKSDSTPYPDLIIYAYHTDTQGYYSKKGNETGVQKWHGYLYGYGKTDNDGRYEIHTIRPGRYPVNKFPAHIHWSVKEPDGNMFYLNDFVFSDDSLVNEDYLSHLREPGDNGVIVLKNNGSDIPEGSRLTILK